MSIRDIIKTDMHELYFNDKIAYCEKQWYNRKICWFNGGVRPTLDYLTDDDRYTFKETMYLSNKPKYDCLSKIFIWNGPFINKYRMSNFNIGSKKLHSFKRGLHE